MVSKDKIDTFPTAPGVYLMKDSLGTTLYVGKARDLRKRVRSYFSPTRDSRYHIRFLMERVVDLDYIVTDTEKEALILENTLIKKFRPKYNFNLRDDKTYFSLRLDLSEEFPRLSIVRKTSRDGARYFGPYSSASDARDVLKQLQKIFPLRHYPLETCRRRRRPCLFYQLKLCSAPCHGRISTTDYAALVNGAALFLEGKRQELVSIFKARMADAAAKECFEEAARYRDLLHSIEVTLEKQKMVTQGGDTDVLGYHQDGRHFALAILFIRGGTLIGSKSYNLEWEMDVAEGLASFLGEYYNREISIPDEILVPLPLVEPAALEDLLSERRGRRVAITHPQRGTKADLVALATKNAISAMADRFHSNHSVESILLELQRQLHLPTLPRYIECYDISNIQGLHAVGSKVSFVNGRADKSGYRHYRIKTISQADDFGMMQEVLSRRFQLNSDESPLPDLIIVDGGIGQLNVLTRILRELHIEGVATASLAKSRVKSEMSAELISRSNERVFLPGRKNPITLKQNSSALLLLANIRDEAHRFAITYHKKLRYKSTLTSQLDVISGIGEKRKKELLRHFGSLEKIKSASQQELLTVPGFNASLAEAVWTYFHPRD